MKEFTFEQYSPEWWAVRKGVPTASQFFRILTPKTGKLSASADDYAFELVAALYDPNPPGQDRPASREMMHGLECEPEARSWYELETGSTVRQVGFVLSDCGRIGCSPDGLVGEDGGLELKCPTLKTQAKYLYDGGLPVEYKAQVHGSLIVTGREWWDFLSYAPGLPPLYLRITPDDYTAKLRDALAAFLERLETIKAAIAAKEAA